jgi:hypothetical protein
VFLAAPDQRTRQPIDQFLPAPVRPEIGGAGEFVRLIQVAVRQRVFALFESNDQHRSHSTSKAAPPLESRRDISARHVRSILTGLSQGR